MLVNYLILGVDPRAGDETIRKRYLTLIRKFPPEKAPEQFQRITKAYEALKSRRARIENQIFGPIETVSTARALGALGDACRPQRKVVGLKTILEDQF